KAPPPNGAKLLLAVPPIFVGKQPTSLHEGTEDNGLRSEASQPVCLLDPAFCEVVRQTAWRGLPTGLGLLCTDQQLSTPRDRSVRPPHCLFHTRFPMSLSEPQHHVKYFPRNPCWNQTMSLSDSAGPTK